MKTRSLIFAAAVLCGSPFAQASTEPQPAQIQSETPPLQQIVSFDGTWEGKIFFDKEGFLADSSTPNAGATFRIEVSGPVVRVFYDTDSHGTLAEFIPGSFHIDPVFSNAVIWGTHSGGLWVETWTFVAVQKDKDTLVVDYVRSVDNLGLTSDSSAKFSTRRHGEFKRIAP